MYEVRVTFGPKTRNNDSQYLGAYRYLTRLASESGEIVLNFSASSVSDKSNEYDFSFNDLQDRAFADNLVEKINSQEGLCAKVTGDFEKPLNYEPFRHKIIDRFHKIGGYSEPPTETR